MPNVVILVAAADKQAAANVAVAAGDGAGITSVPLAYASRGPITDPAQADWYGGSGEYNQSTVDALNQSIELQLRIFPNDETVEPLTSFLNILAQCDPPLARIMEEL